MPQRLPRTALQPDSSDTESWLVEELAPHAATRPAPDAGSTEEAPKDASANGASPVPRDLARATVEVDRVRAELAETEVRLRTTLVDEIRAHAKALDHKQRAMADALAAFSARLDALEERLRSQAAESADIQETLSVLARYRRHEPGKRQAVKALDLNSATFEDLRGIGLSATQATRVLTYRETLGGFDSGARLREVPGLPDKVVRRIRTQTHV